MKDTIINCIRNNIQKKKEQERLDEIERKKIEVIKHNQELVDKFERENKLIPKIEEFFSNLPKDIKFEIATIYRNNPNNPEKVDHVPGSHTTYPLYVYYNDNLEQLDYEIIEIENKFFSGIEITGKLDGKQRRYKYEQSYIYDYSRKRERLDSGDSFKYWNNHKLKLFIEELEWFEKKIAEKYGCENA